MPCEDFQLRLHGYLDGELDPIASTEVERHLKDCPACAKAYENQLALRSVISNASLYTEAPPTCASAFAPRCAVKVAQKQKRPCSSGVGWPLAFHSSGQPPLWS